MKERDLYPIVERWMNRHYKCFKSKCNTGLKFSRCDVVGLRDVGGDLSGEIETICIEVKKGTEPFATASGQALGYRVYANRVFLADRRMAPFTQDEIAIASSLGIGLIQIKDRKCVEVLSSPLYRPLTRLNLRLLEQMAVGFCQLCGSYFDIGEHVKGGNRYAKVTREKIAKAIDDDKGIMFWNWEVSKRKRRLGIRSTDGETTYERRFVCPDCISRFISQLVPENSNDE